MTVLTSARAKGKIKNIASKNGADPRGLLSWCIEYKNVKDVFVEWK